jgi:hypothetical protein
MEYVSASGFLRFAHLKAKCAGFYAHVKRLCAAIFILFRNGEINLRTIVLFLESFRIFEPETNPKRIWKKQYNR